ncbi:MAG: response regulator [Armatimonadetes bacterium]|nr:response regulator [Armatimonadota bacterium]
MTTVAGLRVLVVEDEGLVAVMVGRMLQRLGHSVVGYAPDGAAALTMAAQHRPDLVLMDVDLPEMDGIEVTRRLTESAPTPVVVLTAHQSTELVQRAAAAGVGAYLTKPPSEQALAQAIPITLARFADLVALRAALAERDAAQEPVARLEGIIPICSYCRRVRDSRDRWQKLETYIARNTSASFTHCICKGCEAQVMEDLGSA